MKNHPGKSPDAHIVAQEWDGRDFMGRLQLVIDNNELFWDLRLITRSELKTAMAMAQSALEYVVSREDHPIFTSLDLKADLNKQIHQRKLRTALRAVFK